MESKDIELADLVIKYFPLFFGDFKDWQYGNGKSMERDIKRIYRKAKKLKHNG